MTDWDPQDDFTEYLITTNESGSYVGITVSCKFGTNEERMWGIPLEKCQSCKHHIRIDKGKVMCRAEQ